MDLFNVPAVNDYGIQPFSGYHFNIFVNDAASGNIAWVGAFQSLTYSIRNATETYLEVGQRIPMYLDGEINIAWVLEQGMLDGRWMQRTFGTNEISRDQVLQEFPRFHITYDCNAQSLAQAESIDRTYNSQQAARLGATDWKNALNNGQVNPSGLQLPSAANMGRLAQFRYEFSNCKVDNVSGGIMPGRRVPAKRWEGVAQGVRMVEGSVKSLQRTPRGTSLGSVNLTPTITQ
ncbi:MAG: hypothetical protein ACK518_03940 [bacterium]|jgi:hypothetical protein